MNYMLQLYIGAVKRERRGDKVTEKQNGDFRT